MIFPVKETLHDMFKVNCTVTTVFRIRIQLNPDPDPAKNLNPDPSYFVTLSENNIKLFHNYKIFSSK